MLFDAALRLGPSSLLREARSSPEAFASFYDAYVQQVLIFIARRVLDGEVALDLVSETFATALERRLQFRGQSAEEEQAWLYAIARSQLSHYWHRGHVERAALRRVMVDVPHLADHELERIEDLAGIAAITTELRDAMAELPDDQRRAVELRVVEDLSYDDLARVLNVNPQTARARVSRGLRRLAQVLKGSNSLVEDPV
jgi:RNA polymerase sigma-70 factor (ECF subfamily)